MLAALEHAQSLEKTDPPDERDLDKVFAAHTLGPDVDSKKIHAAPVWVDYRFDKWGESDRVIDRPSGEGTSFTTHDQPLALGDGYERCAKDLLQGFSQEGS